MFTFFKERCSIGTCWRVFVLENFSFNSIWGFLWLSFWRVDGTECHCHWLERAPQKRYKKRLVSWINSSLLLKIIFHNAWTLQLNKSCWSHFTSKKLCFNGQKCIFKHSRKVKTFKEIFLIPSMNSWFYLFRVMLRANLTFT